MAVSSYYPPGCDVALIGNDRSAAQVHSIDTTLSNVLRLPRLLRGMAARQIICETGRF
jgi:hypothetical protein